MAAAEDYAKWIVANQDKKGTPEFDTVAKAYQVARAQPQSASDPTSASNLAGAAIEPNLQLLSGMVAQPVAGIAGLGAAVGNAVGLTKKDPAALVRETQSMLTYQPRTEGGKNASAAVGYLPEKLADLADFAGQKVADVAGPGQGAIVNTLIHAVPGLLGARGKFDTTKLAEGGSTGLMKSALKPSKSDVAKGSADRAVDTLLNESNGPFWLDGVNVTPGGAAKLDRRVGAVNDQIADAIMNSTARVDKNAAANRLQGLVDQVERQVNPAADVSAITNADIQFRQHPLIPGSDMPVQLAQEIKQGTYKQLKDKYGEMGSADTEAQKTLARGLKEEIAAAVPEVGPLNARESSLLNAKDLLERRVAVSGNKNPIGLQAGVAPSVTKTVLGMLDRSELVKSLLARLMNPGGASLPDASLAGATGAQTFSEDAKKRQAVINALMGR